MSKYARVLDVQEMAAFRVLLVKFAEAVRNGLAAGDAEVRDMQRWLSQEQPQVWARRIKQLERDLADAVEALRRKQSTPTPTGEPPNVMIERTQLRRAKERLEEARARAARTLLWSRRFEREESVYRGGTNGARTAVQSTLPTAARTLDDLLGHLAEYMRLTATVADQAGPAPDESLESGARPTVSTSVASDADELTPLRQTQHDPSVDQRIDPEDDLRSDAGAAHGGVR